MTSTVKANLRIFLLFLDATGFDCDQVRSRISNLPSLILDMMEINSTQNLGGQNNVTGWDIISIWLWCDISYPNI